MNGRGRGAAPLAARFAGGLLMLLGATLVVLAAVGAAATAGLFLRPASALGIAAAGVAAGAMGVAVWRGVRFAAPVALVVVGILLLAQLPVVGDPDRDAPDVARLALVALLTLVLAVAARGPRRPTGAGDDPAA